MKKLNRFLALLMAMLMIVNILPESALAVVNSYTSEATSLRSAGASDGSFTTLNIQFFGKDGQDLPDSVSGNYWIIASAKATIGDNEYNAYIWSKLSDVYEQLKQATALDMGPFSLPPEAQGQASSTISYTNLCAGIYLLGNGASVSDYNGAASYITQNIDDATSIDGFTFDEAIEQSGTTCTYKVTRKDKILYSLQFQFKADATSDQTVNPQLSGDYYPLLGIKKKIGTQDVEMFYLGSQTVDLSSGEAKIEKLTFTNREKNVDYGQQICAADDIITYFGLVQFKNDKEHTIENATDQNGSTLYGYGSHSGRKSELGTFACIDPYSVSDGVVSATFTGIDAYNVKINFYDAASHTVNAENGSGKRIKDGKLKTPTLKKKYYLVAITAKDDVTYYAVKPVTFTSSSQNASFTEFISTKDNNTKLSYSDDLNVRTILYSSDQGNAPGYGDLPLSCQPTLLSVLDATRRLGITLTPSLLMVPTKSVTAVLGYFPQPRIGARPGCKECNLRDYCSIRASGTTCHGAQALS